jgi:hypothetical protein
MFGLATWGSLQVSGSAGQRFWYKRQLWVRVWRQEYSTPPAIVSCRRVVLPLEQAGYAVTDDDAPERGVDVEEV